MHLQFVESSKRKADIIVPTGLNSVALDLVVSKLKYTLSMNTKIGDSGKRQGMVKLVLNEKSTWYLVPNMYFVYLQELLNM